MQLLLKKVNKFNWNDQSELIFNTLKGKLLEKPTLQYPNFEISFILAIDASQFAIGLYRSIGYCHRVNW